jgi:hypothetical protein
MQPASSTSGAAARTLFILPTYGAFSYARKALLTFRQHCLGDCLIVDDASPKWEERWPIFYEAQPPRVYEHHFPLHGGLTRSWNFGLQFAKEHGYGYALCGNSDLLFTPGCLDPLRRLAESFQLIGPLTNCPGPAQYGQQQVKRWLPDFKVSDDADYLADAAARLQQHFGGKWLEGVHLNGFCLFAKIATWWDGAFDSEHVFRPRNDLNSRGQRNPDPLNCLNEDELQGRWRAKNMRSVIALDSLVFHYRAVSRGQQYARVEGAYRPS